MTPRRVCTVASKAVVYLEITCGEYQAQCGCYTTFRNLPEGVLPRSLYDNKVRDLVLDRILQDGMSVERTLESLHRAYLLDLSTGFVYDVLHNHARQLGMAEHRRAILHRFSDTLCIDELHLGRFTLFLATDPLADLPVAFVLVDKNDQEPMRRFLKNLKTWGLNPKVVVTDGSTLYPTVLAELWPDAAQPVVCLSVPVSGEGPLQVASSEDAGAFRGDEVERDLGEGTPTRAKETARSKPRKSGQTEDGKEKQPQAA